MKTLIGTSLIAISLLMTINEGAAEVFKCKTPKGIVYQGTPCVDGDQSKPMLTDSTADFRGHRIQDGREKAEDLRQQAAAAEIKLRQSETKLEAAKERHE